MATKQILGREELTQKIREADWAYYVDDDPIMSDKEYDALYAQLVEMEKKTGIVMSNSPTNSVPGAVKGLQEVRHPEPMLSCEKTKSSDEIAEFMGDKDIFLSWKADGLTLVLRYENGELVQAVTRGDGEKGEDVTHNICAFANVPVKIDYKNTLIVRGEAVMPLEEFERVNALAGGIYDSPRNLAAGTIRKLDPAEAKKRKLVFYAFRLVMPMHQFMDEERTFLAQRGFSVIPGTLVRPMETETERKNQIRNKIVYLSGLIPSLTFPMDGLVAEYNDRNYGLSLGATGHHPRCQKAFKWEDETQKTILRDVLVNVTRSGVLSFRAQFDPVKLDGATVQKATLHNIDILESLELGIGDELEVYRANKIIPAVAKNNTRSGTYKLPTTCPVCGKKLIARKEVNTRELVCENPDCRRINILKHFCGKKAADIHGVADTMLRKLVDANLVRNPVDLYNSLPKRREDALANKVCTEAGWDRLMDAIEKSRDIDMDRFLVCLDIPMLGSHASKALADEYHGDIMEFAEAVQDETNFAQIVGIGNALGETIRDWFTDLRNISFFNELRLAMRVKAPAKAAPVTGGSLSGCHVCITGTLSGYTRSGGEALIQKAGGIVDSTVTRKTDYLVVAYKPGKSKQDKAAKFGTKILTEGQFMAML